MLRRVWPDRIHQAMVLPVKQGSSTSIAVLIAGASPRRPLDDGYRGFFELIVRQFAAAIADAQTYEAERARAEALAEIDRAKTDFFSNVSHEFRTPLTLLLGPLEEAARKPADGLTGEALDSAHRNALRLLRLVNTLLDFSRIEAGRIQAQLRAHGSRRHDAGIGERLSFRHGTSGSSLFGHLYRTSRTCLY